LKLTGEVELVKMIQRLAGSPAGSRVVLGIGDDAAIYRPKTGDDLVFTTDMMIQDVHFVRATHPPAAVGHKALARGLSDLAAMGAEPRFSLLSVAFPMTAERAWITAFFRGFIRLARDTGAVLAGGDLARAERFFCDVSACGAVAQGQALRRDGARPGDVLCVSGHLGGSALGLASRRGAAWRRHLRPNPRLDLGIFLRETLRATAAIDVSDGLSLDLYRLCLASGVAGRIDGPLPVFHGATMEQALHGGEDYELLFTLPAKTDLPSAYAGVPLTRIGTIERGPPGYVEFRGEPLPPLGYDHFRVSPHP
jgi:thiamine-monophosphate kinase